MSDPKRNMEEELAEFDPFADKDFELEGFVESMSRGADGGTLRKQAAWQRLEEHRDIRRLRAELEDWDDWELTDSH